VGTNSVLKVSIIANQRDHVYFLKYVFSERARLHRVQQMSERQPRQRGKRGGRKSGCSAFALGSPLGVVLRREQRLAIGYGSSERRDGNRLANSVYQHLCMLGNNNLLAQIDREPTNNVLYENVPESVIEPMQHQDLTDAVLNCAEQVLSDMCLCAVQLTVIQRTLRVRLLLQELPTAPPPTPEKPEWRKKIRGRSASPKRGASSSDSVS
jgi:hypothetical protein